MLVSPCPRRQRLALAPLSRTCKRKPAPSAARVSRVGARRAASHRGTCAATPDFRFPVSSHRPFPWCAVVDSRRNGSVVVQSKGRAIARERPHGNGFAAKPGAERRLGRSVLIHRRINVGAAAGRHRLAHRSAKVACVRSQASARRHGNARARIDFAVRAGFAATAIDWRLCAPGARLPHPREPPHGSVSESQRFATTAATARFRPAMAGKSLTKYAARQARRRHARRSCASAGSKRLIGFRRTPPPMRAQRTAAARTRRFDAAHNARAPRCATRPDAVTAARRSGASERRIAPPGMAATTLV